MNKKKVCKICICSAVIAIIIAGISMLIFRGFAYSLTYQKSQRMNIYMEKEFEIDEIKNIVKEVLGNKSQVQLGNKFGTVASITFKEISDEQKKSIIEKINEKYEIKIDEEKNIVMMNVPQANVLDIISFYILPVSLIAIISLVFFAIRYREKGIINTVVLPFGSVLAVLGIYVSAYSLIRIPVNELFSVIGMCLVIVTLLINTIVLKKEKRVE